MPRLTNHVPKYCRHRASGQAVVTFSGVDHYLGPFGTQASRRKYNRLVAEWMQNDRQPIATTARSTIPVAGNGVPLKRVIPRHVGIRTL